MEKWTVRFNEYMKFKGVKESIDEVKRIAKQQRKRGPRSGDLLERDVKTLIERGGLISVDELPPQYDVGFGADFKLNYKKDDKNFSFFVDITSKRNEDMEFFTLKGNLVQDIYEAFCYETEEFKLYLSIKRRHSHFFEYKKPVIVMFVQHTRSSRMIDTDNVDLSHSINITHMMIALHEYLCDQGYGARASHYIHPKRIRFYEEYKAMKGGVRR